MRREAEAVRATVVSNDDWKPEMAGYAGAAEGESASK